MMHDILIPLVTLIFKTPFMEKEQNHGSEHRMCDWCGNEYGRKYSWLRLVVGILIGLFIFSAGYHLGELNVLVHSQYGTQMMQGDWNRSMHGHLIMNQDANGTSTTIVVPAQDVTTTAPVAPQQ
jgi:hypothetical protein